MMATLFTEDFLLEDAPPTSGFRSLFPDVDAQEALERRDLDTLQEILESMSEAEQIAFVREKLQECWDYDQTHPTPMIDEIWMLEIAIVFELLAISDRLYTLEMEPHGIYQPYDPSHLLPEQSILLVQYNGQWTFFTQHFAHWFLKNAAPSALPRLRNTPFGRYIA